MIGGNVFEMRILLKWKVFGLYILVVGYVFIIEKELFFLKFFFFWLSWFKFEFIFMEEGWDIGYEREFLLFIFVF